MVELTNSTRRLHKATYTPIRGPAEEDGGSGNDEGEVPEPDPDPGDDVVIEARDGGKHASIRRGWEKLSFVRNLAVRDSELPRIESHLRAIADQDQRDRLLELHGAVPRLTVEASPTAGSRVAPELASVEAAVLVRYGRELATVRQRVDEQVQTGIEAIERDLIDAADDAPGGTRRDVELEQTAATDAFEDAPERDERPGALVTTPRERPSFDAVVAWATEERPERLDDLYEFADSMGAASAVHARADAKTWLGDLRRKVAGWGTYTEALTNGFEERMTVEPVGRLHLERLDMTPVGIERGELLYTVPLAPTETVNISHKEWSLRTEEFEDIVTDVFEEFSEEGVTENTDLSQSSESQSRHSTAFSLSANYSHFGASAAVGYESSSEDAQAQRTSREQSIEITRKASSRARREHKYSFKVSSVAGTEDREVRVLSNPSSIDPMRVDYYELLRKWRVDLYRYGLRMTYDIVIPNPGGDLVSRLRELREIDAALDSPFSFDLPVSEVTRESWEGYAAEYGARVEPPPEPTKWVQVHEQYPDELKKNFFDAVEFDVDPAYEVADASFQATFVWEADDPSDAFFDVERDRPMAEFPPNEDTRLFHESALSHLHGKSGRLAVNYSGNRLRAGAVTVVVELRLKRSAFRRWRFEAWDAIRGAAERAYFENRQVLQDRREALETEIASGDALTLRKMEREEVMKGVLRWLFGPSFELVPDDIEDLLTSGDADAHTDVLTPSSLENGGWKRVMEFGEFVKYLHQAIEWENVLFFTYPYFWDAPEDWSFKRHLDHPDPRHQEFLRAGSARVVLTIRPGFEQSFAELIDSGAFGSLDADHPYVTIAEEIRNYAETNYPGIPSDTTDEPADEADVAGAEAGVRIGRWYEYTPTSALDIAIDTDLSDMA